jgi:transcriptional regulator with XRE-family HTH domain
MVFLGYEPFLAPTTLTERMLAFRRREGLSVKDAALRAGVDEASWSRWEQTG